jgi:hypothetical protein
VDFDPLERTPMIVGRAHAVAVCLALLMLTVGCVREHTEPADPWPVGARIAIAGTVTTNTNTPCLFENHPEPCVEDVDNFLEVATEHGLVRLWYDHGESDRACSPSAVRGGTGAHVGERVEAVGVSMSDGRAELDACGDEGSYVLPSR